MRKVLFTFLFLFMGTALFAQIPVTFSVDMGPRTFNGNFNPESDVVVIRGSFQTDAGDAGGDWQGGMFEMADEDGDTVYTLTVNLPSDSAGKAYAFKFVQNSDGWESSSDRNFTLTGPAQELPVYYFNNDSTYVISSGEIPVTFSVDMGVQAFNQNFNIASDFVVVRGNFQTDAGDPGGDWQGEFFKLEDPDGDTIYTVTANIPDGNIGKQYSFKFVRNADGWEGNPDRTFTLEGPEMMLPVYHFNNDTVYNTETITNTINFTADLSGIIGVGAGGAFDPNQDSILVMGLDWDGLGAGVVGERRMVQDPFNPSIYTTTLSFNKLTADSTKWKFRAFPPERFSNTGWEDGNDNWYYYGPDGHVEDINAVPRINPVLEPLQNDVEVNFRVDVTNAKNRYNNNPIDPASIEFVGLRGGAAWLGSWSDGGNWIPSDTTEGLMKVLNDDGVNGDLVADDNIWSIRIIVPAGTVGGAFEYKFAAMYPGADTVNGGSSPLDNEGGFGTNHRLILRDGGPYVFAHAFGDFVTSVRQVGSGIPASYTLEQNFPNPFNPSTKIRYSVPNEGMVNIRIYNLVGELIGNIVNEYQKSGSYEVDFNAANLATGVYFYTIQAGSFQATKKMLLMK